MSDVEMDRELVKEWVAALRSGNYQQGRFKLRTLDTYCCLGVAYDIATDGKGWVEAVGWVTSDGFRTELPYELSQKLGLSFTTQDRLATMNDKTGMSFSQIADWIETNILGAAS